MTSNCLICREEYDIEDLLAGVCEDCCADANCIEELLEEATS